jgi:DNA primase
MPKGIKKGDIIFFEHLIDFKQEIYITEGIFDAIRIGFNAIPLLGTIMSKKLVNRMVSENTPSVGIFLDTDAYEKAVSIARYLIQKGIKVKIMHDSSFKDVGEMPKQHIENLIKKTDYLTKNSFIDLKLNLQF